MRVKALTAGLLMAVGGSTGLWVASSFPPAETHVAEPEAKKEVLPGLYLTQPGPTRPHPLVAVFVDEYHRVTCWHVRSYKAGGISCIPNSQLAVKPRPTE